ncbi:MAG: ATP-binding protein, partial [Desulfobacula sp.]|nr:ATP-binding protein [Desulfobacula sp.]
KKIFAHGFTTKKDKYGFGLHSSANSMTEMGGEMWAESDGIGKGATFVLRLPVPDSLSGTVKNKNNKTPQIP